WCCPPSRPQWQSDSSVAAESSRIFSVDLHQTVMPQENMRHVGSLLLECPAGGTNICSGCCQATGGEGSTLRSNKTNRRAWRMGRARMSLEKLDPRVLLSATLKSDSIPSPVGLTINRSDDDGLTVAYVPPTHMLESPNGGFLSPARRGDPFSIAKQFL